MKTPREILLARHRSTEPKLDRIRRDAVNQLNSEGAKAQSTQSPFTASRLGNGRAFFRTLWLELIWPCRRTWVGLTAVWVALVVINLAQTEPARTAVAKSTTSPTEVRMALLEQQRLLTELIGPPPQPSPAEPPRRKSVDQPRSERRVPLLCA
jgi:hypothetical protein